MSVILNDKMRGLLRAITSLTMFSSAAGLSVAAELTVELMGQAGIEDPAFEVLVNGAVVGSGVVTPSAKSQQGQYLSSDIDLELFKHTYHFEVNDIDIFAGGTVAVRFLNDYHDPEKGIDANLYVLSIAFDEDSLDLATSEVVDAANQPRETIFSLDGLGLYWTATATLPFAGRSAKDSAETPVEDVADHVAPAKEAVPAVEQPLEPVCAVPGSAAVTDYPNGEVGVTTAGKAQIDRLLGEGDISGCTVEVTGYSSFAGPEDVNMIISEARAQNVLKYIVGKDRGSVNVTARGLGQTDQFGVGAENRRVVVTLK